MKLKATVLICTIFAFSFQLTGCSKRRSPTEPGAISVSEKQTNECILCHGGKDNNTGAPPPDLNGRSDPSLVTVGSHTIYLKKTESHRAFGCPECHVTPKEVGDPGHMDTPRPAEVIFGSLAKTDGSSPVWDRVSETCQNVYCHGASLGGAGGSGTVPSWTHPKAATCGTCHDTDRNDTTPNSVISSGGHSTHIAANSGPKLTCPDCHTSVSSFTHVDGKVDFKDGADSLEKTSLCSECHGSHVTDAKLFWKDPSGTWLTKGYCESCHDGSSTVKGKVAPAVTQYYQISGHGNTGPFKATNHGKNGPGWACIVCHDPESDHIGGNAGKRLRIDNSASDLCLDCHIPGKTGHGRLGKDATAEANIHSPTSSGTERYVIGSNAYNKKANQPGIERYVKGFQCIVCHNPHGTSNLAMIREQLDGGLGAGAIKVRIQTMLGGNFAALDTTSGLDPSPTPDNGVCDVCHGPNEESHLATKFPNNMYHGINCANEVCHDHTKGFGM